jgi:ATP-dependent exoDNAse (exonuclease V) alpha subunit
VNQFFEDPHPVYSYAVTRYSSQGQTADRELIHVDTEKSELLINNRFAYVSVSRAQHDAHIYENDGSKLPVVSVAKVRNEQQPKWNRSWLRRRPNRLASEGDVLRRGARS